MSSIILDLIIGCIPALLLSVLFWIYGRKGNSLGDDFKNWKVWKNLIATLIVFAFGMTVMLFALSGCIVLLSDRYENCIIVQSGIVSGVFNLLSVIIINNIARMIFRYFLKEKNDSQVDNFTKWTLILIYLIYSIIGISSNENILIILGHTALMGVIEGLINKGKVIQNLDSFFDLKGYSFSIYTGIICGIVTINVNKVVSPVLWCIESGIFGIITIIYMCYRMFLNEFDECINLLEKKLD